MTNKTWDKKYKAFQQAIRAVRVDAGFTQAELAQALGKPQSYVSKYESGERKLDYLEVGEICEACGTTIAKFDNRLRKYKRASA